jgi:uncharacterized protein
MKTRHWILAFLVVGIVAIGLFMFLVRQLTPLPAVETALDTRQSELASRFLDHLEAQRYAEAHAMFAPAAATAIDMGKLEEIWTALPRQLGELQQRGEPRGELVGERPVTTFPLQFERMTLDARISIDAEQRIDGFRLVPGAVPKVDLAPPPADITEREFPVSTDALPGTLTLPRGNGPFPAVVLVHGSGPHDRDQSIGPNRIFRDMAHGLAALGVAVLRYEKRTHARPDDFADGQFTVDLETVDDAIAAVAALRGTSDIDRERVFVAGHSLGALMAPRIGQRAEGAAGLIMLAAPARGLDVLVMEQVSYLADLDGERSEAEAAAIAQMQASAQAVHGLLEGGPEDDLLLGLPAPYWRDLLGYDPVATAADLPLPMLILQGGRDYQVTVEDFTRWQQALGRRADVQLQLYPRLNHLFAAGEGMARPEEYFQPAPFDPQVIGDIAEWIHGIR